MDDQTPTKPTKSKSDRTPRKRQKPLDFAEFRAWLANLAMHDPILHVNGAAYPTVALTVDFGTPLVEQKLTTEQNAELITRMRTATKSLFANADVNVRVQNDTSNGVWWTAVG